MKGGNHVFNTRTWYSRSIYFVAVVFKRGIVITCRSTSMLAYPLEGRMASLFEAWLCNQRTGDFSGDVCSLGEKPLFMDGLILEGLVCFQGKIGVKFFRFFPI